MARSFPILLLSILGCGTAEEAPPRAPDPAALQQSEDDPVFWDAAKRTVHGFCVNGDLKDCQCMLYTFCYPEGSSCDVAACQFAPTHNCGWKTFATKDECAAGCSDYCYDLVECDSQAYACWPNACNCDGPPYYQDGPPDYLD